MRVKKFIFILLFLLIIPKIVYTHSAWLEAAPDEGAILSEPPQQVFFKMIGHLHTEGCNVEVFDEGGNKVSKEAQFSESGDFSYIQVKLIDGLKAGEYTVIWTFENKDKHKQPGQKGSYKFTIK
jgi:methionine-rich copper-binding protein CopC